jgi:hypothetical protein
MAIAATAFGWVHVQKGVWGVWTRIAQGPIVQFLPFQELQIVPSMDTLPTPISVTLDGYSAAPPFYERDTNTVNSSRLGVAPPGIPPVGFSLGATVLVTTYLNSPYSEFWLLLSMTCWAHLAAA